MTSLGKPLVVRGWGGFVAISQKWVATAGGQREMVSRLAARCAWLSVVGIGGVNSHDHSTHFLQLPAENAILYR